MKWRALSAVAVVTALLPAAANARTVLTCPFNGAGGGDRTDRGFYVTNYAANNINAVTLAYQATTQGTYKITLTARSASYDGALLGRVTATASLPTSGERKVKFKFPAVRVARGSTITFSQTVSGPGVLFYDDGTGSMGAPGPGPCPTVVETAGTSPRLDHYRRHSVGLIITALDPPGTKITSSHIDVKHHQARFGFRAIRAATAFQCALVKSKAKHPHFSRCVSPRSYAKLAPGGYKFEVRAVNAAGPDPTPAIKRFTI